MRDIITVTLGGRVWSGWKSAEVTRGLDRAAASFSINASRIAPDTGRPLIARPFDPVTVQVAGRLVMTGFVDRIAPQEDEKTTDVTVVGRSRAADLIDCAAQTSPGSWRQARADTIIRDLVAPFGIPVRFGAEAARLMDEDVDQGERVMDVIERVARRMGVIVRDAPDGSLVLERPSARRAVTALVNLRDGSGRATADSNVLASSGLFDAAARYSEITVTSQAAGTDLDFGAGVAGIHATVRDDGVPRYRPLTIIDEGSATKQDCRLRAEWERARRFGKSQQISATVAGWLQSPGGLLWDAGLLVRVRDKGLNVDADLVAASVNWSMTSDRSALTTMVLQPPEAFEPERVPSKVGAFAGIAELFD